MPGPMSNPDGNGGKRPTLNEKIQRYADLVKGKVPYTGKTAKVHGH